MLKVWSVHRVGTAIGQEPFQNILIGIFFALAVGIFATFDALFVELHQVSSSFRKHLLPHPLHSFLVGSCNVSRVLIIQSTSWESERETRTSIEWNASLILRWWVLLILHLVIVHYFLN